MNNAYLNDHMHVELFGVEANAFIESSPLAIIKVHSHIDLPCFMKLFANKVRGNNHIG